MPTLSYFYGIYEELQKIWDTQEFIKLEPLK